MKLDMQSSERLLPFKVLANLPDFVNEVEVKKICGKSKLTIVDLNNLTTLKKFMIKNSAEVKGTKYNSSMKEGSWSGTDTWNKYIELLDNGDENVMKKIKIETDKKVVSLEKQYKEVLTNYRFDVTGQFFDVGLVLTGVPETWLEPEPQPEETLRIDILINGGMNSSVNEKTIVNSSARILAISKILEDNGVQVGLKMINFSLYYDERRSRSLLTTINLKDYDEPINYHKLSSLMSPSHNRRGVFKLKEVSEYNMDNGYGRSEELKGVISLHDGRAIDELERKLFKQGV
ncbi:MAG: hypothetical protein KAR40_16050 [Candidatus Sabulitectum sp.]|nr:hypothetical protein [Candidatus Sabulitectum sp.]